MYPGWMIIGTQDPLGEAGEFTEIVNNPRAFAYANRAGLCWLQDCNECDPAALVIPGWPFVGVKEDPAPWYDQANPDSWGFLGIIGLDVTGEDSSTRTASVTMGINNVGAIGPTYMTPRTMVSRALAIATDECSLQFGLAWLRKQYATQHNPCGGDTMTFFDCCPCVCADPSLPNDCWANTYEELATEPACETTWWPATYGELLTGPPGLDRSVVVPPEPIPPDATDEWCNWIVIYRHLNDGPPQWSCCLNDCVAPYYRQFYNVRVTEGPIVLNSPALNSNGAVAEIEFTIVAADPVVHGTPTRIARAWIEGADPWQDPAPPAPYVNPYRPTPTPLVEPVQTGPWVRDTVALPSMDDPVLTGIEPRVSIHANARSGPVRLGLWAGETRVAGYTIPFVDPSSQIVVAGKDAYHLSPDGFEKLPVFVRDWDGKWPRQLDLPHGDYSLTIDQHPDEAVRLFVDVLAAPVGSA